MADFFQNGEITTLHKLGNRSIESMEKELSSFAEEHPMALILPSLFSELKGDALPHIVEELTHSTYIRDIIVGLDCATKEEFEHAKEFFSELPQNVHILWNDGDRLRQLDAKLQTENLAPLQAGKGRNAWYCFGYALALDHCHSVALHDCDILTYDRSIPARLFYPVTNPTFNFEFCKGYYPRVNGDKLGGRVTRLFVTPMIRALKKVLGPQDYLDYMDSFRYTLSGEFSMSKNIIKEMRIPSDWGLEIGVLSEVYRNLSKNRVCQVDIADQYDHKHQDLNAEAAIGGLEKMAMEISKSLFRKLATEGCTFSESDFRAIKACYFRMALDCTEQYYYDSMINGLHYDRHLEEKSIELFSQCILKAGESYLTAPMEAPFIPNWNRVLSVMPDFGEKMMQAVELDNL